MIFLKYIKIGNNIENASAIALGCMRIHALDNVQVEELIMTALDNGINFFDHADIYGKGKSEELFGEFMANHKDLRDKMIIQTKCAIRPGYYDFSKEHIIESVETSLKRMNLDYIDVLLLHRPDTLMEPEEVGEAFEELYKSGKVKNFGVSNHNMMQVELLKTGVNVPLVINQLQLSIVNAGMITSGINVNMENKESVMHDGFLLEYSRLKNMTIQAWSPFRYGKSGVFLDNPDYPELNAEIDRLAEKYGVKNTAIAAAWILRHPAKIQVIAGTTNKERLSDICKSADVDLTRQEWYSIYRSAGHHLP